VDVTVCRNCGSYKIGNKWLEGELYELLKNFLRGSIMHKGIKKEIRLYAGEISTGLR